MFNQVFIKAFTKLYLDVQACVADEQGQIMMKSTLEIHWGHV
jgi:hypothetical protein